ncbi:MAG: sigma-70 family RNA polymerase sigma factor [Flavobacteriales bacterium]|nr:sigma-70 family RNA polymerase sigma factor [Flavobacteriales bacterium]
MHLKQCEDSALVKMYQCGNEKALEELVVRHRQRIYAYILTRVHDQDLAEDLFQDAFIKVIKTLKEGKYNEEGKFLPWVLRISHNLIIDHFRRNKRMPMMETTEDFDIFDVIADSGLSAENQIIKDQIIQDVRKLIQQLPPEQKEVLIMRHYAEMSFKDIAEQTGVSINTALGRMRYALINLRKLIAEHHMNLTLS